MSAENDAAQMRKIEKMIRYHKICTVPKFRSYKSLYQQAPQTNKYPSDFCASVLIRVTDSELDTAQDIDILDFISPRLPANCVLIFNSLIETLRSSRNESSATNCQEKQTDEKQTEEAQPDSHGFLNQDLYDMCYHKSCFSKHNDD